jgi:hypothetical protein
VILYVVIKVVTTRILNLNLNFKLFKFIYLNFKNGSMTEKAGLHMYTKYHEAVMLLKFSITVLTIDVEHLT